MGHPCRWLGQGQLCRAGLNPPKTWWGSRLPYHPPATPFPRGPDPCLPWRHWGKQGRGHVESPVVLVRGCGAGAHTVGSEPGAREGYISIMPQAEASPHLETPGWGSGAELAEGLGQVGER